MSKALFFVFLVFSFSAIAEDSIYKKPDDQVAKIVEGESFPSTRLTSDKKHLIKAYYNSIPPIDFIATPIKKLAGLRFLPSNRASYRSYFYTRIEVMELASGKITPIKFPEGTRLGFPGLSPEEGTLAIRVYAKDCVQLWLAKFGESKASPVKDLCLNEVVGSTFLWKDEKTILAAKVLNSEPFSTEPFVAKGPLISETSGQISQNRTYQDLLENQRDEEEFTHFAQSQLVLVDVDSKKQKDFGKPGIFSGFSFSPSRDFIRIERVKKPYSYVVPYYRFARDTQVFQENGEIVTTLADLPVADAVPIHGVPEGPRSFEWIPNEPATLLWAEALDKGDWNVNVPHRDEIFLQTFKRGKALPKKSFYKVQHRFSGTEFFIGETFFLFYDYERDRKWIRGFKADYKKTQPGDKLETQWSYNYQDVYNRPGNSYKTENHFKWSVTDIYRDEKGRWIFTSDKGATPNGEFPYLKKVSLDGQGEEELFRSPKDAYESFVGFTDETYRKIITRRETSTESSNLFIYDLKTKKRTQLTNEANPAEIFSKVKKELLTWKRADGTLMSGVFYYPLNYEKGKKYPTVVSAYPVEYTDKKTAGQTRGSSNKYSRPWRASYLYLTLKDFALLQDAQMPVVGHPKTMNDTLIEQLKMNADAIKTALKKTGVSDTKKLGVIGHSYGAFMVANLLTHSNVFKTGVARSGAYNRTLTPFGFQSERRPFWEAKEAYLKVSPFMHAEKLKKPVLLIHGDIDNNSGTFTMQSKRYFAALKGNGVQSRLVLLPHESHGYSSMESVLHVLWETENWFEKYLKN